MMIIIIIIIIIIMIASNNKCIITISLTNIPLTPVTPFISVCVCVCLCVCMGVYVCTYDPSPCPVISVNVSLLNRFEFPRHNWEHFSNWVKDVANRERGVICTIGLKGKRTIWAARVEGMVGFNAFGEKETKVRIEGGFSLL